jgi:hypothetical protein
MARTTPNPTPKRKATKHKPEAPPEPAAEHNVPPPRDETEPELPRTAPPSYATDSGLVTDYPDRTDWEADVSRRAREEIHEGKGPKRTKGPTTEAD